MALRWTVRGHGYGITGTDVLEVYDLLIPVATNAAELTQQLTRCWLIQRLMLIFYARC